jgi:integrase
MIPRNPADPVKVSKLSHKERRFLSPEEAQRFLEAAGVMPNGLIFEVALVAGMRPEEYLALQWSDVDFARRTVIVQRVLVRHQGKVSFEKPKTPKSRRSIPLPESLIKKLADHKRRQAEHRLRMGSLWRHHNLVFCSEEGTPHQIPNITYRYFRPILKKAGLPQIRLYDLRHSQATFLLMADENPKVVSERLGHSTVKLTLDTYRTSCRRCRNGRQRSSKRCSMGTV